ncbi:MAG: protein-glutamate O-methyltransferase CheR [Thermodesulfobacteriota bacterium]|nr:protein-glutamate O-methyltransferase CheR [Thermodesulfobacteriota bacterium]
MNKDHLQELLTNVWQKTGYDFREYRRQTIERRIAKRMALLNVADLPAYREILDRDPEEYWYLISELTIKVSRLFRNPYVFEFMDQAIWPELLRPPGADKHLRLWSAGCAYGEETYSLAISILDHMERKKIPLKDYEITIIGTDIDEEALMLARAGQYGPDTVGEVKKRLLDRYFDYKNGYYNIMPVVRKMVTFAVHDLTSPTIMSPPSGVITNYDLISCRNLLIYFAPALQERVLSKLLRVLNPGGYLVLGESEALPPQLSDCLRVFDKRANIYQKMKGT